MAFLIHFIKGNYRTVFAVIVLLLIFYFSIQESYLLFHTVIELFSIVVAFAVFIVAWNTRVMQDNNYLRFVGISYLFVGALDLLHTLTYKGMRIIEGPSFFANQFWVATRFLEAVTLVAGFYFLKPNRKLKPDLVFLLYFLLSTLVILTILVWNVFPVCYIEGMGQTPFKIYAEYVIIATLILAGYLLIKNKRNFSPPIYQLLFSSLIFTILSEFCFTLYVSNYSTANEIGHYAKLISFFLIYKANVETGFLSPTQLIFKNLKDKEETYRTLAENMPGLILRLNDKLDCIYMNSAAKQLLTETTTLDPLSEKSSIYSAVLPVIDQVQESGTMKESSFSLQKDGKSYFYALQVIPESSVIPGESSYLIICQDVTKLKLAEGQMKELNGTKDKLFSIIAHDLKNPFTSLLAFSELIYRNADKLNTTKIQQMAQRMNESAKQAYALLENLLDWSRIQTGALKPHPEVIAVPELLSEIKELNSPMADAKKIGVTMEYVGEFHIMADYQMIATVLRNLISNAIKFSYANSMVTVKAENKASEVLFSVTDTGIGIEGDHQNHLLKIDNKFSTPGTAAEKGTGLGLVLCKEFVELNGGQIYLKSDFGLGTTFFFTVPSADKKNF
ncbi:MASE3 domain-containing protein [Pedobacter sp. AW31-3R]|uniref:sensor histidine kinase n=1 Tax=Pedobacter sp. AW31-3R TaxID=3445781 RepID=UPI003FA167FE